MKNQTTALRVDTSSENKAERAILQIQKWVEKKYPRLAKSAKTKIILECLIELTEERKFLAAH